MVQQSIQKQNVQYIQFVKLKSHFVPVKNLFKLTETKRKTSFQQLLCK